MTDARFKSLYRFIKSSCVLLKLCEWARLTAKRDHTLMYLLAR